jgi:hypothetical protein
MRAVFCSVILLYVGFNSAIAAPTSSPESEQSWQRGQIYYQLQQQDLKRVTGTQLDPARIQETRYANDQARLATHLFQKQKEADLGLMGESKGKQLLQENPELMIPAVGLGVAARLWVGQGFKMINQEFLKLSSSVEIRNRRGQIQLESLLGLGTFKVQEQGYVVEWFKQLADMPTNALNSIWAKIILSKMNNEASGQTLMLSQLGHQLSNHVSLVAQAAGLGVGKPEATARIDYRLNF